MAIEEGAVFAVKPSETELNNGRKPRRKKGDERPFCPAELNLKPSRYNVAERLYAHFAKARNDAAYGLEWNRFKNEQKRLHLIDALKLAEKRAKLDGQPRAMRVRPCRIRSAVSLPHHRCSGPLPLPAAPTRTSESTPSHTT